MDCGICNILVIVLLYHCIGLCGKMVTLNEKGIGMCSNISIRKRSFIIKIGKSIKSLSLVGAVVAGLSLGAVAEASTVTVKAGDTVSEIALANGTTISQIQKDNNLKDVNLIFIGDKLKVNEAGRAVNAKPVQSSSSSASQSTQSSQSSVQPAQSASSTSRSSYTGSSVNTSNGTLSDSEAQAVANQMASRTGQSASYWKAIMWRESRNQVHASNPSSTATGLFQTLVGGEGDVQSQIDNAVNLYEKQGTQAWALN